MAVISTAHCRPSSASVTSLSSESFLLNSSASQVAHALRWSLPLTDASESFTWVTATFSCSASTKASLLTSASTVSVILAE
jgi:hypothetical protein